jgi:hypothetical protein
MITAAVDRVEAYRVYGSLLVMSERIMTQVLANICMKALELVHFKGKSPRLKVCLSADLDKP